MTYEQEQGQGQAQELEQGQQLREKLRYGREPVSTGKNEDVEFSEALADEDDLEAVERAEAADRRQQNE